MSSGTDRFTWMGVHFHPGARFQAFLFTSDRMWVDTDGSRLFVVKRGDILVLSFRP